LRTVSAQIRLVESQSGIGRTWRNLNVVQLARPGMMFEVDVVAAIAASK
jgi:hypothetical protein